MAWIRWPGAQIQWVAPPAAAPGAVSKSGGQGPARAAARGAPYLSSQFRPASMGWGGSPRHPSAHRLHAGLPLWATGCDAVVLLVFVGGKVR